MRGTPDVADLVLGVSGRGAGSAAEVMARIADRAQKVIDALHDAGVSDDDIQTADLSVQPVLDDDGKVDRLRGEQHRVGPHPRPRQGGRDRRRRRRQGGRRHPRPGHHVLDRRRQRAARRRARTKATKRARAQAEQLASGADVEVGEVRSITESTSSMPLAYAADAAEKAASTPVMPGSQTLSVQATVVFAIR